MESSNQSAWLACVDTIPLLTLGSKDKWILNYEHLKGPFPDVLLCLLQQVVYRMEYKIVVGNANAAAATKNTERRLQEKNLSDGKSFAPVANPRQPGPRNVLSYLEAGQKQPEAQAAERIRSFPSSNPVSSVETSVYERLHRPPERPRRA